MTLLFSVNSTFSQHPCPWHLWERNPQIPLGLHHWSKFSRAGEGLGCKQEVSGLLATLLPGAKTGVHLETENNRTKLTFTISLLQLFCVDILTQYHLGISLSRTAIYFVHQKSIQKASGMNLSYVPLHCNRFEFLGFESIIGPLFGRPRAKEKQRLATWSRNPFFFPQWPRPHLAPRALRRGRW